MKKLLAIALVLAGSSFAVAKGYVENQKTLTHDCATDKQVRVMGNGNTLTVTGACDRVAVMGNQNTVVVASSKTVAVTGNENTATVDSSDEITNQGKKNTITWKRGVGPKDPTVKDRGKGSAISKAK